MAKDKKQDQQTPEEDLAAEMLLKDADDALRQEKLSNLWEEWGSTIIGTALMIIFGTMIGVGWQNWRASHNAAQTALILNAQDNPTAAEANLTGSHAGLYALLRTQEIAVQGGDNATENLFMTFQKAAEAGLPQEWDILAQWGTLRAQADGNDADLPAIATAMQDLAGKRNNPYAPAIFVDASMIFFTAGDIPAAIAALQSARDHEVTAAVPPLLQQINALSLLYNNPPVDEG